MGSFNDCFIKKFLLIVTEKEFWILKIILHLAEYSGMFWLIVANDSTSFLCHHVLSVDYVRLWCVVRLICLVTVLCLVILHIWLCTWLKIQIVGLVLGKMVKLWDLNSWLWLLSAFQKHHVEDVFVVFLLFYCLYHILISFAFSALIKT